jgi:hypothetical protein
MDKIIIETKAGVTYLTASDFDSSVLLELSKEEVIELIENLKEAIK